MNINRSGAKFSKIVGIGQKIKELSRKNEKEYLFLNRGVNAVCNIDLSEVIGNIDFNNDNIQVYPPIPGFPELKEAINDIYFDKKTSSDNITITSGGMNALDLVFQSIKVKDIYLPAFYWGAYIHIMTIRGISNCNYDRFEDLLEKNEELKDSAVIICDPNNPVGDKFSDDKVLKLVEKLNAEGTTVIFDSPYRRVFYNDDDDFYQKLLRFNNVIIVESFSKSVGLSGQRIGFVHTNNADLVDELKIRLLYASNGVNAFSQQLVYELLTSKEGRKAIDNFRERTRNDIAENIKYLEKTGLLAKEFYLNSDPIGIFCIVNMSEDELLDNYIGSVSLSFFTGIDKEKANKYARICVSVPHEKFVRFFKPLAERLN